MKYNIEYTEDQYVALSNMMYTLSKLFPVDYKQSFIPIMGVIAIEVTMRQ